MKTFQEKNKCKNCERLERLARIQKLLCMKYIKERIKNEAERERCVIYIRIPQPQKIGIFKRFLRWIW